MGGDVDKVKIKEGLRLGFGSGVQGSGQDLGLR